MMDSMKRHTFLRNLAAIPLLAVLPAVGAGPQVIVYKTPTCGCCGKWVEHLRQSGFAPKVTDLPNLSAVKQSSGVPQNLQSCHTSMIDGYAIEGHVPADVIRQLLKEKPKVAGIAVPGMPMGSPGMEGAYKDKFNIVAFAQDGTQKVYASR